MAHPHHPTIIDSDTATIGVVPGRSRPISRVCLADAREIEEEGTIDGIPLSVFRRPALLKPARWRRRGGVGCDREPR